MSYYCDRLSILFIIVFDLNFICDLVKSCFLLDLIGVFDCLLYNIRVYCVYMCIEFSRSMYNLLYSHYKIAVSYCFY